MVYNKFSEYLKRKYGAKVYKLPVNLCVSCPNRDRGIGYVFAEADNITQRDSAVSDARSIAIDSTCTDRGDTAAYHGSSDSTCTDRGDTAAYHGSSGSTCTDRGSTDAYHGSSGSGSTCTDRGGTDAYHGNSDSTCAERGGILKSSSSGGCIFCGDEGAGFEMLSSDKSVISQLESNRRYIGAKYGAEKFIAYFQNYSNTYLPFSIFAKTMEEACTKGIVALYISTRPDCIDDRRVNFLRRLKEEKGVDIVLELGLQSVNHHTMRWLNRGHGLAEFIDAVLRIKGVGLEVCTHMINDLPADDIHDVIEGAKVLSALGTDQVKCHSLYILENTVLGKVYNDGSFIPLGMDEFIERTICFLEYLSPDIVVQRLIGRAPAERTLFCNWDTSWWKIHDAIVDKMLREGRYQGRISGYLNGSALKGVDERL